MSNKREALEAALRAAMKKAFNLGQTYWQQADSHFVSQQNKSDITREEFNKLVNDTVRSTLAEPEQEPSKPSEKVINHAVNRFLGWKLPREFSPDNGIVFKLPRWEGFPLPDGWPVGTNLFTADQSKAMFEYCLDGSLLYTSPREWQELSEGEFAQLRQKVVSQEDLCGWSFYQGAMLAEGALRAKNGG